MAASISAIDRPRPAPALSPEVRSLLSGIPEPMVVVHAGGTIVFANAPARDLLRCNSLTGFTLEQVTPDRRELARLTRRWLSSSSATPGSLLLSIHGARPVRYRVVGATLVPAGHDSLIWIRITPAEQANSRFIALNEKIRDLAKEVNLRRETEDKLQRQNELLVKQKELLESIAQGGELSAILESVVETVQRQTRSGAVVSILLLDEEGRRLRHAVSRGLPDEYIRIIDGIAIGPEVGSCGTAAFTCQPVIVEDILTDPLWASFRDAAVVSGMRACWSSPILSQDNTVLGTFALYYPEPSPDVSADLQIVELCTRTAAVAIQRAALERRREAAERAMRRSESLAAAGRLAATVAHELNNPLEAVTNLIYLAQMEPSLPQPIRELLSVADRELARASHIARRTVGFYRESTSPRQVNLTELVEDVLQLYSPKFSNKALRLEKRMRTDVSVWAAEGEVRQVVSNLVANAIDACNRGGSICVRVANRCLPGGAPGGTVLVADGGSGIPLHARSRVFEPFFTTKKDVGTGLGLWVSKNLAEKHGGRLRFRSRADAEQHGTVFSLSLPRHASQPRQESPDPPSQAN